MFETDRIVLIKDYLEILNDFFNKCNPKKKDIDCIHAIINYKIPLYFNAEFGLDKNKNIKD